MFHSKKIWNRYLIWILIIQTTSASAYFGYVPLLPFIEEEFLLSNTQVGWMTSFVFLGASIMSIPSGIVTDRIGAKNSLFIFCSALTIISGMLYLANNYFLVLLLLFFLGGSYGGITPGTNKSIINNFEIYHRGTVMGIKQTGVSLGSVMGTLSLPVIASTFNWRVSFLTISMIMLLISLFHYRILKQDNSIYKKANIIKELLNVMKNKKMLKLIMIVIFFIWIQLTVMTYLTLYLLNVAAMKTYFTFVCLAVLQFGGAIGRPIWGGISDLYFYQKRGRVLGLIGLGAGLFLLFLSLLTPNIPTVFIIILSLGLGFTTQGWNGIFVLILSEVVSKEQVGIASGLGLSAVYIGAILGTPFSGWLIDKVNNYQIVWLISSIIMILLSFFSFKADIDNTDSKTIKKSKR